MTSWPRSPRNPVIGLVSLFLAFGTLALAEKGALDGKTFVGESGEKGKMKGDPEEIDFKDGKFHSKGCDPYGFVPAAYTASTKEGAIHFQAETTSAKEGKIAWKGTVKGDMLDGTLIWTKPGQAPLEYWVKGKLKK